MEHETDRLYLSRPRLSDAPDLLRFLGDRDAMRYTLHLASLDDVRRFLAGHEAQRRRLGYGPWTVREKTTREIVGIGGLYDDPFEPGWGPEVAYQFAPTAWGKGYATELTRYCLRLAREAFRIASVRAFAHPDNLASRRVLEKAGFREASFVSEMSRLLYVQEAPTVA